MKTITKSIKITEDQEKHLLSKYKNVNQGVQECIRKDQYPNNDIETLKYIRAFSRIELKGKFTEKEWLFFIDILNGVITEPRFRCYTLANDCQDAERFDGTATRWEVDLSALLSKIEKLTGAQVEAIYTYAEEFWNSDNRDLEKTVNELV